MAETCTCMLGHFVFPAHVGTRRDDETAHRAEHSLKSKRYYAMVGSFSGVQ